MSVRAIFTGMLPYLVTPFPHSSSFGSVIKYNATWQVSIQNLTTLMAQWDILIEANKCETQYSRSHDWNWKVCRRPNPTGFGIERQSRSKMIRHVRFLQTPTLKQAKHSCIIDIIQFRECVLCNLRRRNYDWEARHNLGVREVPKFLRRVSMKYRCSFPKATWHVH
jgi:hypothetical protein